MTKTQEAILAVLNETDLLTPRQVSERAGVDNWGGTARSLHVLLAQGKVERVVLFKHRRWNLNGYRLAAREDAARPLLAGVSA